MHKDTEQDYREFLHNMKIKPNCIDVEYKLAHILLCGKSNQIAEVVSNMDGDEFYDLACINIFNTVKEDFLEGGTCEGLNQFQHITTKYLDRMSGDNLKLNVNYAGSIMEFFDTETVPGEDETKMLIDAVKAKHRLRQMVNNLYVAVDMCNHEDGGVDKAYEYIRLLAAEHDAEQHNSEMISKYDFAESMLGLVFEYNDPEKRKGLTINMPWKYFQKAVGGFGVGELVIISAKSGQGKSAFALNVGIEAGVTQKIPTLYINSEMHINDLTARYLSNMAYIDSRKIREGGYYDKYSDTKLNPEVEKAIREASEKYYKSSLLFATIPDLQLANIEKIIRKDCQERNTRLIIVDYIGRMDITKVGGVRDLQEWQIMRLAANRLKTLAQKYQVCIIMVAQLNDEGTLQGSKAMKNEADMWLSINRLKENEDTYNGKRLADIFPYNTFVNIEKARSVSDNSFVTFRYEGSMMRFTDSLTGIKEMIDKNAAYGDRYKNELMTDAEYDQLKTMINFNSRVVKNVAGGWPR